MSDPRTQPTIVEYASLLWRRRRTTLFAAGLFACATFIAFNFVPRKYRAQAVFERRGDSLSVRTDAKIPEKFESLKPVLRHDLTNAETIQQALQDIGYTDDFARDLGGELTADSAARLEGLVRELQDNLSIDLLVNSAHLDRVSITLTSRDPVLAYKLPNQLMNNYIRATRQELRDRLAASCEFLKDRTEAARAKLEKLREEQFIFTAGHPDLLPDNPQFYADRLARLDTEVRGLQQQQRAAEERLAALNGTARGGPAAQPNPQYQAAEARLAELRRELDRCRTELQMTDRHPRVAQLRESIAAAEVVLASIPAETIASANPAEPINATLALQLQQTQSELATVRDEIAVRQQQRRQFEKAQANVLPALREYQKLAAATAEAENELKTWRQNLADVQMAYDAELNGSRTHLEVVKAAGAISRPCWPQLWMVFGLALGGGAVFACVLVVLMHRLGRGYATPGEAQQALGLPLLGVVGPILSPAARRLQLVKQYAVVPVLAAMLIAVTTVAAMGVLMSMYYPGRYAQLLQQFSPPAQALWSGARSLFGVG